MTVPLILLAALSVFAGWLNPGFHIFGSKEPPMEHWLHPVFAPVEAAIQFNHSNDRAWAEHMEWPLAIGGISAFLIGTGVAWWMYIAQKGEPAKKLAAAVPGLYRLVLDKWRVDEFYEAGPIAMVDSLAETAAFFDKAIVDGVFARLTSLTVAVAGTILRAFQNGVVHVYAATMVVGLVAAGWFFSSPHANGTVVDTGNNDFVVTAAPGVGYSYRWDADGDGKPDKADFGDSASIKLHVEPGKNQTVNLEVRNSFGFTGTKQFYLERPPQPVSSL
jgi:NADH-quinone oxidoreductase subunit L